ncbi:cysteine desulfurase IscS [Pseudarcicella hirudinis]|uniref:cysteine desulfurase n=2 Tax=Pseudarcicella hirudinis TaxID=1079859 RepID=A0A1I5UVQ7_9BACT|nr:cysteine desulfurase IscS [Pseudarcicella hirudinis]
MGNEQILQKNDLKGEQLCLPFFIFPASLTMNFPIYLDYNATTPVDQQVLEEMLPYFSTHFGNAASRTHFYGWKAAEAIALARERVAALIGADDKEIIFTSGSTEANNLALKGIFELNQVKGKHIITVQTEHKAILDVCKHLEKAGAKITYLKPDSEGLVTASELENAIRTDTILVTIMHSNNETGVILPIAEMAEVTRKYGIPFHTDATQSIGKVPFDVNKEEIDLMSLSAHKFYGPKGIGVLFVRKNYQVAKLVAQMDGGSHERGLRSGTLNVPGIVGLGKASELAINVMEGEQLRISGLRNQLEGRILSEISGTSLNGNKERRLPNVSNISFADLDGEQLLLNLRHLAVSNGSACTSASINPSHVLKAMGLSDELAHSSIRFSLGKYTTEEEINFAVTHLAEEVNKIRAS